MESTIVKFMTSPINQDKYIFIVIIKCLATLLITNAHIGPFYPENIRFLSFGGALGNALFFFCSGYILTSSIKKRDYLFWLLHRIFRIMIPTWIFLTLSSFYHGMTFDIPKFICTPYWFINAIIIFYLLYYPIIKHLSDYIIHICISLYFFTIILFYITEHNHWMIEECVNNIYIHYLYYFSIMLIGGWISIFKNNILIVKSLKKSILSILFSFSIYMSIKYNIIHTIYPIYSLQLLLPILLLIFSLFVYNTSLIICKMHIKEKVNIVIKRLSNITLEIYLVQFVIMDIFKNIIFPYGLLLVVIFIYLTAELLHNFSLFILKKLKL